MKSKLNILLTLTVALLIASHEMTMSFGLPESSVIERSEEVPSRESEENTSEITVRAIRPLLSDTGSNFYILYLNDSCLRKVVTRQPAFFKSSLHILFLSLRH